MIEMERRVELKRMQIEKPIALFVPGRRKAYRGTTSNMSDAGICAGFKKLPKNGDDVMLHIFWKEDRPPIEQPARLVWSDSKALDGRTRVGLQLRDEPQGTAPEPTPVHRKPERTAEKPTASGAAAQSHAAQIISTCPTIERGGEVRLLIGGVAVDAVASTIGEIRDDNTVEVVLEITDPAFSDQAATAVDGGAPPEDQDWTPHPFRDAWRATVKVLGPSTRIIVRYSRIAALTVASAAATLFQKIRNRMPKKLSAQ